MPNPDRKYGRHDVTMHPIESMKDCILSKLKYVKTLDFKKAVRACVQFGKRTGFDLDGEEPYRFYVKLFDEINSAEALGFIKVERYVDDQDKERIKEIRLSAAGEKWFEDNDFDVI